VVGLMLVCLQAAVSVAQILRRISELAIREQLLGNYVERVAAMVTDAVLVPHVLSCLAKEGRST